MIINKFNKLKIKVLDLIYLPITFALRKTRMRQGLRAACASNLIYFF